MRAAIIEQTKKEGVEDEGKGLPSHLSRPSLTRKSNFIRYFAFCFDFLLSKLPFICFFLENKNTASLNLRVSGKGKHN